MPDLTWKLSFFVSDLGAAIGVWSVLPRLLLEERLKGSLAASSVWDTKAPKSDASVLGAARGVFPTLVLDERSKGSLVASPLFDTKAPKSDATWRFWLDVVIFSTEL